MATRPREHLYILDGNAILHRAWHALPPLQTKDGTIVNAVYGFLMVLLKLLREEKPTHLAVTFDREGGTFRHEAYKEYKATRKKQPDELYNQIPILQDVLSAMRIPTYDKKGYEADDLIGTIATKVAKKNIPTTIVTGDLDTLQLISPEIDVYTFGRGIKEAVIYDQAAVKKRYGLIPEQLIDFKALRGDPSDNIPGVRGIGDKTAAELLQTFDSLEGVYAAIKKESLKLKKFRERVITLLKEGEKDARQSKELVTILRDAPIEFQLTDTRLEEPDHKKVTKLFQELGFRTLLDKLPSEQQAKTPAPKKQAQTILNAAEAKELAETLKKEKAIALRVFPRPENLFNENWLGVAFAWDENKTAIVPKEFIKELVLVFDNPKITKIGHDLKIDLHALREILRRSAPQNDGPLEDVTIASYLLNPGTRAHGLETLVFEHFGKQLAPTKEQGTLLAPTLAQAGTTASEEVVYIFKLQTALTDILKERAQLKLYSEIEMPLVPALVGMERHGVKIDTEYLKKMSVNLKKKLAALSKNIYKLAGEEFNINSPAQLKVILFEKLKIPAKVKKTATGELSTAAGELEKLRGIHPIIDLIFEHRGFSKLLSTYVDALPELVQEKTKRVHTSFNQTITATGRLSSSNPNLQNIPIRTELGREIRKTFIADRGYVLVAADYSQIELRMIAEIAKVKRMQRAFREGEDIHKATAAEIWNVPLGEVTKEQRHAAKTINFGLLYGMGPASLARSADMSPDEARDFIQRYFDVYPEIREYVDETKALAATEGYVETIFGRRRYLPEIRSGIPQVQAAAERMAINAPVQGSAADLMKLAMIQVHEWIAREYGLESDAPVKMLLQVHDELVFEVKKELVFKATKKIKNLMEDVGKFSVPIIVEVESGKNWGEMV